MDEKVTAYLRVTSCSIISKTSKNGDVLEIKANGMWLSEAEGDTDPTYPLSLHMTAYPGCGVIPVVGDNIKITVERE